MAVARSQYLIEIELVDGQVQAKLNGVNASLGKISKEIGKLKKGGQVASTAFGSVGDAAGKAAKKNQDLISSSGLAGATLVETGRLISDLPFGITAVTNNLSQLSTLFVTLISKTEGAGNAISLLGKQLMGPLGIILVFQVFISLIQAYQKEIIGFFKGTEEANEATKKLTKSVDDLTKSLEENNKEFKEANEVEKNLNTIREESLKTDIKSGRERTNQSRRIKASIKNLKDLGIEIDETRIKEEGYLQTLLESNKTSKEISKELENRRIQLQVDRILGRTTPLELAQRELDLFIDTQKELKVLESAYLESEEYRTLVAKRDALKPRAETDLVAAGLLTPEGITPFAKAEITSEDLVTKNLETNVNTRIKLDDKALRIRLRNLSLLSRYLKSGADAFGEQTVAYKAINVSAATIDAYVAFNRVIKEDFLPGPLRFIAAAAVLATGLANVKKILAVKIPGKSDRASSAGAGGAGGNVFQAPDFNIVGASTQSQLAQTIAGAEAQPVRAFVVGKDITTQQELDRNTTRTASFG